MLDSSTSETLMVRPAHAKADHPAIAKPKIGILLANLGTPDNYDYWSMRRYLNEFLSDRRVIDYSPWIWQPLLQLIILSKRPFSSGAAYKSIWNEAEGESPLMTITKAQTAKMKVEMQKRHGDGVMVDFCMRYGNPSTRSKVAPDDRRRMPQDPVFPALSALCGGHVRHGERRVLPRPDTREMAAGHAHCRALFRPARLYRGARAIHRTRLCRARDANRISWSAPITACRTAT